MHIQNARIGQSMRKSVLWFQAAVLVGASVLPVLLVNSASAATVQLTNRKAEVTNAIPGTAFDITFEFDTPTNLTEDVEAIEFEFTDDPLAAYDSDTLANTPTGTAAWDAQSGFANATNFVDGAFGPGRNATVGTSAANNQLLVTRTEPLSESGNTDARITLTGLTHDTDANTTFYVRMRLYNDAATQNASTLVWEGAVAQSTSQTLNVSARVQERLAFCVGSTVTDDADASDLGGGDVPRNSDDSADLDDCSDVDGTNVNLGVVDNTLSETPVATTNGGNATNGIAMVNTNAVNGTVISYAALQESGSGTLKVDGASCVGAASVIDQCFNSAGATQGVITGGVEEFGMTIGGVNCGSNPGTSYTCDYSTGDTNLTPQANYVGAGANAYNTTNGYAWVDDGTYTNIASSGGSTIKVIEDEALILKFGATAAATTPTGTYDVDIDFVATPTF